MIISIPKKKYTLYLDSKNFQLFCFCDADWAGNVADRKSTSGYAIFIDNALLSWSSKKQSSVTLSTMEAEYIAMTEAIKEHLLLKKILFKSFNEEN